MLFTAALCGLGSAALWWLLHAPYRGVGRSYYDIPRRFLLTGCASGMGRHLTGFVPRHPSFHQGTLLARISPGAFCHTDCIDGCGRGVGVALVWCVCWG